MTGNLALTVNDIDDADFFSRALGQKTMTVTHSGFNSGGSHLDPVTQKTKPFNANH